MVFRKSYTRQSEKNQNNIFIFNSLMRMKKCLHAITFFQWWKKYEKKKNWNNKQHILQHSIQFQKNVDYANAVFQCYVFRLEIFSAFMPLIHRLVFFLFVRPTFLRIRTNRFFFSGRLYVMNSVCYGGLPCAKLGLYIKKTQTRISTKKYLTKTLLQTHIFRLLNHSNRHF